MTPARLRSSARVSWWRSPIREDLFYRVNVVPIQLPPLRERKGDVPLLVQHFIERHGRGREYTVSRAAMRTLERFPWPGNVRELENAIQRALTVAAPDQPLVLAHFSEGLSRILEPVQATIQPGDTLRETLGRIEAWLIRRALQSNGGRRATTARGLGITREGLYN